MYIQILIFLHGCVSVAGHCFHCSAKLLTEKTGVHAMEMKYILGANWFTRLWYPSTIEVWPYAEH